ncbi:hypothetical protein HMPREF9163_02376 [Selenomonas sp. oral taxon 138 str. F0429]|nr:hypothetical protein HMPREF9163_02376 [Selenomonas sp. oral taxon 138 str. F0429]
MARGGYQINPHFPPIPPFPYFPLPRPSRFVAVFPLLSFLFVCKYIFSIYT